MAVEAEIGYALLVLGTSLAPFVTFISKKPFLILAVLLTDSISRYTALAGKPNRALGADFCLSTPPCLLSSPPVAIQEGLRLLFWKAFKSSCSSMLCSVLLYQCFDTCIWSSKTATFFTDQCSQLPFFLVYSIIALVFATIYTFSMVIALNGCSERNKVDQVFVPVVHLVAGMTLVNFATGGCSIGIPVLHIIAILTLLRIVRRGPVHFILQKPGKEASPIQDTRVVMGNMGKIKNVSLLKSGIKRIGSFCSRTRSDMLKEDQEETEICFFDDDRDEDDDDDDDSCLWLSSSASPSSFFSERSPCCSSFVVDDEWIISSEISLSSSNEVVVDLASWVLELEKDMTFLANLDLEYCCIPSSFPSPSFATCCSSLREAEAIEEASELEHLNDDEQALFWPFDEGKLSWNPDETWISFAMSPRKDIDSIVSSKQATTPPKSLQSVKNQHDHQHNNTTRFVPKLRRISSLLPRRRTSSSPDSKPAAANKVSLPSRLVKASESSSSNAKSLLKAVPLEVMMANNKTGEGCLFDSVIGRDEVPIEKLMGLEEFDGHEGIDPLQSDDGLINGDGGDDNLFSLVD